MVRGNGPKRVEMSATRRAESKQRNTKRHWKQLVLEFQSSLDRISALLLEIPSRRSEEDRSECVNQRVWQLHIWTDTIPMALSTDDLGHHCGNNSNAAVDDNNQFTFSECFDTDDDDLRRRMRSQSLGDVHCATDSVDSRNIQIKSRARSNSTTATLTKQSFSFGGKTKKMRPRSNSNNKKEFSLSSRFATNHSDSKLKCDRRIYVPLYICRSYFYTGSCNRRGSPYGGNGRRGESGCPYFHGCCTNNGVDKHLSLWHVLSRSKLCLESTKQLQKSHDCERQYVGSLSDSTPEQGSLFGGMDMLYHLELEIDFQLCHNEGTKPSEIISEAISTMQLHDTSIVYIVVDKVLVFDRYRTGRIYDADHDLVTALLYPNVTSIACDHHQHTESLFSMHHIPGTILVHILFFLPDSAIGAVSCVCQSWNTEIRSNPAIWKHMLQCRNWPYPTTAIPVLPESNLHGMRLNYDIPYRDDFCQHYSILRDMNALRSGWDAILDPQNSVINSREMTYRQFSSRNHSSLPPGGCVSIHTWSPNCTLVAYDQDCTLRLFETQGEGVCKEVICQKIDPYKNTKKRTCQLLSMDLDEQCVACLGCVTGGPGNPTEAFILLVMSREDFLIGDTSNSTAASSYSEDMSKVTVIDVGEAIFYYLISLDKWNHQLFELIEFFGRGGAVGDVEMLASRTIIACGYGRFMIEVKISIPAEFEDIDNDSYHLLGRKLFLFSSSVGAIVWSCESNPSSHELLPRHHDMTLACLRRPITPGGSRCSCFFAVRAPVSFVILAGEVDPSGTAHSMNLVASAPIKELQEAITMNDGWEILVDGQYHAPLIVTPTDVITADLLVRRDDESDRIFERKTILSFYSRYHGCTYADDDKEYSKSNGLCIHGDLEVIRMSLIRDHYVALVCRMYLYPPSSDRLFYDVIIVVVIVHVPSRMEICRTDLSSNRGHSCDDIVAPFLTNDCTDTIGLSLSWKGVAMTGHDVRKTIESSMTMLPEKPHRKKSTSKRSSK